MGTANTRNDVRVLRDPHVDSNNGTVDGELLDHASLRSVGNPPACRHDLLLADVFDSAVKHPCLIAEGAKRPYVEPTAILRLPAFSDQGSALDAHECYTRPANKVSIA